MKKLLLSIAAIFFTAVTFAQTTNAVAPETSATLTLAENTQMQDLDHSIQDYNIQKAKAKQAYIKGGFDAAKAGFAIANTDKQHINTVAGLLKSEGVPNPLKLARKEIKKADHQLIMADIKNIKADKAAKQKAKEAGDISAIQLNETNLIADKRVLKDDIRHASHDSRKHITFIRIKA